MSTFHVKNLTLNLERFSGACPTPTVCETPTVKQLTATQRDELVEMLEEAARVLKEAEVESEDDSEE